MPNWCENELEILVNENSKTTISDIKRKILNLEEDELDFDKIIPMPKDIYRGELGEKEKKKYGKKNWYDWSIDNWGTKWNAIIKKLHEMFDKDEVTIIGHYVEESWDYAGVYHREAMGYDD